MFKYNDHSLSIMKQVKLKWANKRFFNEQKNSFILREWIIISSMTKQNKSEKSCNQGRPVGGAITTSEKQIKIMINVNKQQL